MADDFWGIGTYETDMRSNTKKRSGTNVFEIDYLFDFTKVVAPKMVEAGIAVLEPEVKKNLGTTIGNNLKFKSRSTDQLLESVDASHVFHQDAGRRFKANIYFHGNRRKTGFRNGEIAAYKEYGTPHRSNHDQAASGFISKAVRKTKTRVENAMRETLENELKV